MNHPPKLVDFKTLLETLWDKRCRPSPRWLRTQIKLGRIPCARVGGMMFFDPQAVKDAMFKKPGSENP